MELGLVAERAPSGAEKRSLFVHLGPHKTGTTYLQRLFSSSRSDLEAQGLLYPPTPTSAEGHHRLAQELLTGPGEEASRLATAIEGFAGDALLSSENFSRLDAEGLGWFRAALPDHRIEVIHFVRGRAGTLYSLWQEDVKHGSDVGLVEYVATVLCRPYSNRVINPALLLDIYEPVVDDFSIVVYDNVIRTGGDIFDVFVGTCLHRTIPERVDRPGHLNRSLDPVRVEIIRLLNYLHVRRGGDRNHLLRSRFLERAQVSHEVVAFVENARSSLEGKARSLPMGDLNTVFLHLDRSLARRAGSRVVNLDGDELSAGERERSYEYFAPEETLECLGGWEEIERLYEAIDAIDIVRPRHRVGAL